MQDIQIFDNFILPYHQDILESTLLGDNFSWYYNKNISYNDNELNQQWTTNDSTLKDTDAFLHNFLKDGYTSVFFDIVKPILYQLNAKELYRVRGVFVNKNSSFKNFINIPHVDLPIAHLTAIYYVNNADGDTVIFQERWNGTTDCSKKTVEKTISPKKGRLVLFDGQRYHTGSVPSLTPRVLININFAAPVNQ